MASMIGPIELHSASQITFPHAILQYNSSIQFFNTILRYNSPIQVSNNPPIHVLCIPQSPPAAASAFFATAHMVLAASFQKNGLPAQLSVFEAPPHSNFLPSHF